MPPIQITNDFEFDIAIGRDRNELSWKNQSWSFSALVKKVSVTQRTHETYAEYCGLARTRQDEIKDVGGFVGGYITSGRKKKGNILHRQLVTLDIDHARHDVWDEFSLVYGEAAVMYSTHKHCRDAPRLRLILPLDREVRPDEYQAIARRIAGNMGIEIFDHTTFQPERLMYWPSTARDGAYEFRYQDGPQWSADELLNSYVDWKDSSEWPVSSRFHKIVLNNIKKQGDPLEKKGPVGAFCRTYSIHEAIEKFLPDIYDACESEDRYTYKEGSTTGGLIVYDDKYTYSHHGTDPTSMQLCNAFDLVRLHKFGLRDEDARADTPITRKPSMLAMVEFATSDTKVRRTIGAERFAEANADFNDGWEPDLSSAESRSGDGEEEAEGGEYRDHDESAEGESEEAPRKRGKGEALPASMDWVSDLEVDKNGKYYSTLDNVVIILANDPRLKDRIVLNVFDMREAMKGDMPWRKVTPRTQYVNDRDLANLKHYLERTYGISSAPKVEDALKVIMERNQFHPVKDYLGSLVWDGEDRLDTMLVDYMGAEDSEYVRAVTRKTLVAAVARIYQPGCKFDYMLTLIGKQGVKKSTLIHRLGGDWFSDSLTTMHGKEAYEQLQGAWLIEVAELAGMRKSDIEAVKQFVSKREDRYRVSYGRRVEDFPRQCVFIGTTNDRTPLRDATGGRRFWTVAVHETVPEYDVAADMTPEVVGQLWAEAVHRYKAREPLFLSAELEEVAAGMQSDFTEGDERVGMVQKYLDTLLPLDWEGKDIFKRRAWLAEANDPDGMEPKGVRIRTEVCAVEIFVECFHGRAQDVTKNNTKDIHDIMRNIEGFEQHKTKQRFGDYGVVKGYFRTKNSVASMEIRGNIRGNKIEKRLFDSDFL